MNIRRVGCILALVLAVAVPAAATPIVEYTSSGTLSDSRPFTLGFSFTTTTGFTIDALGYWDDGLTNSHQVGLWTSTGTLLLSTTVLGTDPITGHFRYSSVSPFFLAPGSYVIGGEFLGNGNLFPAQASGVTSLPGYIYGTDLQIFGSGLNFPTLTTNGSYGANGILAANLSVVTAPVPEPGTLALVGLGIVAIVARSARRRRD